MPPVLRHDWKREKTLLYIHSNAVVKIVLICIVCVIYLYWEIKGLLVKTFKCFLFCFMTVY
jgi:hypothetical protein